MLALSWYSELSTLDFSSIHKIMVYGYARLSTVGQTLDSQLEQLRAAGCIAKIYREKMTGAHSDRRELLKISKWVGWVERPRSPSSYPRQAFFHRQPAATDSALRADVENKRRRRTSQRRPDRHGLRRAQPTLRLLTGYPRRETAPASIDRHTDSEYRSLAEARLNAEAVAEYLGGASHDRKPQA